MEKIYTLFSSHSHHSPLGGVLKRCLGNGKSLQFLLTFVLMLGAGGANGQNENELDYTRFIKNNKFSDDVSNGWEQQDVINPQKEWENTDGFVNVIEFFYGGDEKKPIEKYIKQSIDKQLPTGTYTIVVNALYRLGYWGGNNENNYGNDGKVYLYVKEDDKETKQSICHMGINKEEFDKYETYPGKTDASVDFQRASNAFYKGDFCNTLTFYHEQGNSLEIGIYGEYSVPNSWCAVGPIRMYQREKYEVEGQLDKTVELVTQAHYEGRYTWALTNHRSEKEDKSITDKDKNNYMIPLWSSIGNDDIKMYLGGWKYQNGDIFPVSDLQKVYQNTVPNYMKKGGTEDDREPDYWDIATDDGRYSPEYDEPYYGAYGVNSFGADNARSEFLAKNIIPPYVHTFAKRGGHGKGNPFTLPCFGSFMRFEPATDGTVVLYVLQNGIMDLSTDGTNKGGLQTDKAKWRPTYIVDEAGNQLTDKDGVTAETEQTLYIPMDGNLDEEDKKHISSVPHGKITGKDENGNDLYEDKAYDKDRIGDFIDHMQKELSDKLEVLDKYWTKKNVPAGQRPWVWNEVERIIPPSDTHDGWVAINKAFIRYTFKVKAGKTYYVFNNDSKIGFCGYEFAPSETKWEDLLEIDQNDGDDANTTYSDKAGQYKEVKLKRSFKQGWNAICLPFSVPEDQMRKWFGTKAEEGDFNKETYELVTYNGASPHRKDGKDDGFVTAHFFHHAYQNIIAGYPYMLYIPEGAQALKNKDGDGISTIKFENVIIEKNIDDERKKAIFQTCYDYIPDYVKWVDADNDGKTSEGDISSKEEQDRILCSEKDDYIFKGNFAPVDVPMYSYVAYSNDVNDGIDTGIRLVPKATNMKGFRAYLHPHWFDKGGPSTADAFVRIAGTNFSDVIDESTWGDATVINDLAAEMGLFNEREDVYSVTGQLIRKNSTSLNGLPKGVYIVNGKKHFVK